MIRVFLLDDHEVVRRGIAELVTQDGDIEIVGSPDQRGGDASIPAAPPHVAILRARLPTQRIDVCRTYGPSTQHPRTHSHLVRR